LCSTNHSLMNKYLIMNKPRLRREKTWREDVTFQWLSPMNVSQHGLTLPEEYLLLKSRLLRVRSLYNVSRQIQRQSSFISALTKRRENKMPQASIMVAAFDLITLSYIRLKSVIFFAVCRKSQVAKWSSNYLQPLYRSAACLVTYNPPL